MNDDMIHVAWLLLSAGSEETAQARARRAVSTGYYALFHALAASNADVLVEAPVPDPNWLRAYRALDHRTAKTVLDRLRKTTLVESVRFFAEASVELQEKRHMADYDPIAFDIESAALLVLQATQANQQFKLVSRGDRLDLATKLLFKSRP
jgi:hypothetical protein